jgi:hypothetical protein
MAASGDLRVMPLFRALIVPADDAGTKSSLISREIDSSFPED